jgi:hypothetical protein
MAPIVSNFGNYISAAIVMQDAFQDWKVFDEPMRMPPIP